MRIVSILILLLSFSARAQTTEPAIFAHNDYEKADPFHNAFKLGAEYIEADVFLRDGALLVAHEARNINAEKTLDKLYFDPISKKIKEGALDQLKHPLKLMIDLKTSGNTLKTIVELLAKYPELTSHKKLMITISGSYPPPAEWNQYPNFIYFDGRPGISYTTDQLLRIALISNGFASYSKWKGEGELPASDKEKLQKVVNESHAVGKPFRFWAIPDNANSWKAMLAIGVDVINTDKVNECTEFLGNQRFKP